MKKFLAILAALVMVLSLTLCVAADDEVVLSEDLLFFTAGNWSQFDLETTIEDLMEALATPGSYFVVTRSNEPTDTVLYTDGGYEKFFMTDGWWSMRVPNDADEEINGIRMGTANHTMDMVTADGKPTDVTIDPVLDDGIKVWYDSAELLEIMNAALPESHGSSIVFVSNTSSTTYKITNISVVVPAEPIVTETVDETPADTTTENTETPADNTTTETPVEKEPAETGIALAVVPMAVAAVAVALSKKR